MWLAVTLLWEGVGWRDEEWWGERCGVEVRRAVKKGEVDTLLTSPP